MSNNWRAVQAPAFNLEFTHPWTEFPFGRDVQKFVRITRIPTYAGPLNYDKDIYQRWTSGFKLRQQLRNRFFQ
jgi:hypothetical protein